MKDLNILVSQLEIKLKEKDIKFTEQEKKTRALLEKKDSEIRGLKIQIISYKERLETALSNASQKEKENMHTVFPQS